METTIHKGHTFEDVTAKVFEQLILPLKNKLFRFAMSYLKDVDEAKDVVQDVMIKIWEDLKDDSGIRNVEAWCMTLVKNKSLDRLKRSGRNYLQIVDQHHLAAVTADPYEVTVRKEQGQAIRKVINGLPEKQREVISLRDIEGYSYNEIAEILEIELGNVKVLLHRARIQVRQQLKEQVEYGTR